MVGRVTRISFILVLNGVAEGIDRLGELPTEHLGSILRIGRGGWVVKHGEGRSVHTDQAVLAADLPMIGLWRHMVFNPGEESFRSWAVVRDATCFGNRDEILCSREKEGIGFLS
jgi:hypothetical protein